jgi:hypothetical protein
MVQSWGPVVPGAMPILERLAQYIWWLSIAGYLVLFIRLRREGLQRTYRFFSVYVVFSVVSALVLVLAVPLARLLSGNSSERFANNVYGWVWMFTEPVLWLLYILIVLEMYGLVLQKYPGIASLGRWAIFVGLGIALTVTALTLSADFSNSSEKFSYWGRLVLVADRGIASSLVLFLLLITAFLSMYPVPLSRNVVVYSIVYAVYFLSTSMVFLVRNVEGGGVRDIVNVISQTVSVLCVTVWIRYLNRAGEAQTVILQHLWRPEQEQHLIEQLDAINATLLRTARK